MTQRRDVDTYRLTLSELLHEVCVELLDGQDMLEDLSAQRREHQDMDQTADGPHAPAVYEFAEEQIRLRLKRYRELGDRIDEIITLYNELADEALAEDDDDEIGETFSYTGDADWLEWQEIKRKSEDDEYEEDEYEDDDDDDDSNYETDDDPDDESDRVQEWSLKKKKKDKKKDKKEKKDKKDKKEKKDKKDKKEKKHKDKESKNKSEVDAKQLKKAEESSQATVTTVVENRAVKEEPTRKTAAKRSAATTKAKRKTAVKPAAKPKVASKK
ncbi:MAG: hypothetical protein E6119_01365 [Negativicoccus succinicivorans]|uniref:hypothetical protein n=1 Tax=Negativicoccus succinicivorans TaxID=620903 RepID=UPI00290B2DC7|nr:hypothetical protein [Negativicoccus succinicivorans]MDU5372062.1 hypothetical protein [Negativicoccus succinicivorans]MDU5398925.1 hypothetical protein [Negativicoccus succinicivorans]MDU5529542.1 hypothetical protein [Negativicoccus succinicivorans]